MVQGLTAINKTAIELMQSLNASKSEIFWKVRLPSSLPYLFTALKITGSGAVVSAIISEYMYAVNGLGALMVSFMFGSRLLDLWATLLASTILSLLVYVIIVFLEKLLIPWGKHVKEG
jgi:NitT/TauT family transport system permease protein